MLLNYVVNLICKKIFFYIRVKLLIMKKFITLLFILTLGFSYSQENIAWNRVDLYVPANQAGAYLEAMDEFYSHL